MLRVRLLGELRGRGRRPSRRHAAREPPRVGAAGLARAASRRAPARRGGRALLARRARLERARLAAQRRCGRCGARSADGDDALTAGRDRIALRCETDLAEFDAHVAAGRLEERGRAAPRAAARRPRRRLGAGGARRARASGSAPRSHGWRRPPPSPADAVGWARRRLALDPLDEDAARDLMRRLADAGDRAGALAAYDRLADRLRAHARPRAVGARRALRGDPREACAGGRRPRRRSRAARTACVAGATPAAPLGARASRAADGRPSSDATATWRRCRPVDTCARAPARSRSSAARPGIGKTRLAARAARPRARRRGARRALHRRSTSAARPPFGAVGRAAAPSSRASSSRRPPTRQWPEELARLAPSLPLRLGRPRRAPPTCRPSSPARGCSRPRSSCAEHATADRPLVLLFDDVHLADAPTLELIAYLARRIAAPAGAARADAPDGAAPRRGRRARPRRARPRRRRARARARAAQRAASVERARRRGRDARRAAARARRRRRRRQPAARARERARRRARRATGPPASACAAPSAPRSPGSTSPRAAPPSSPPSPAAPRPRRARRAGAPEARAAPRMDCGLLPQRRRALRLPPRAAARGRSRRPRRRAAARSARGARPRARRRAPPRPRATCGSPGRDDLAVARLVEAAADAARATALDEAAALPRGGARAATRRPADPPGARRARSRGSAAPSRRGPSSTRRSHLLRPDDADARAPRMLRAARGSAARCATPRAPCARASAASTPRRGRPRRAARCAPSCSLIRAWGEVVIGRRPRRRRTLAELRARSASITTATSLRRHDARHRHGFRRAGRRATSTRPRRVLAAAGEAGERAGRPDLAYGGWANAACIASPPGATSARCALARRGSASVRRAAGARVPDGRRRRLRCSPGSAATTRRAPRSSARTSWPRGSASPQLAGARRARRRPARAARPATTSAPPSCLGRALEGDAAGAARRGAAAPRRGARPARPRRRGRRRDPRRRARAGAAPPTARGVLVARMTFAQALVRPRRGDARARRAAAARGRAPVAAAGRRGRRRRASISPRSSTSGARR